MVAPLVVVCPATLVRGESQITGDARISADCFPAARWSSMEADKFVNARSEPDDPSASTRPPASSPAAKPIVTVPMAVIVDHVT